MDRFTYTILHVPGRHLNVADTLSRAPLPSTAHDDDLEKLAELLMEMQIAQLPASKERLETYRSAQQADHICSILRQYCRNGWPDKRSIDPVTKPCWEVQSDLTIGEDLLLCGEE